MKEDNPEAVAARLGLKRISNSDYYEKLYEHSGKTVIVYWEDGEFHMIIECTMRSFLTPPTHIVSIDAIYLSCIDGQRLINRDGIILSAPGTFAKINCCCREGDANKRTAMLSITYFDGNHNAAIIRDMGNGEYKWGLLFPPGGEGGVLIDRGIVKKGNDVLFLESLNRTKAYSYRMPSLTNGFPEVIFLQKTDSNYESYEYEVWQNGNFVWNFDSSRVVNSVRFLFWHPFVAHVKCSGREGLLDLKNREILLPFIYKNISIEEGDFVFMITLDGHRCLYDIAERKWIVHESDGWTGSKKRKQYRIFTGESKRAVFYYKERELKG